jgi:signal transduction histidine kinase
MNLFDELFLMDRDGVVRLSTRPAYEKQVHAIDNYFVQGMKVPYIEQPSYSLSLGKMIVIVAAPIKEDGSILGVLAGRASLQSLNEIMLERTGLGNTGETYLVGSNYRLLTGLRNETLTVPDSYIRTPGSEAAIGSHKNGYSMYTNYAGDAVIGVYCWIPDLQIGLLAEQQEGEALRATRIALMIISGVAILAVILAIMAARFLTRSITQPLANLAEVATLIAQGDLNKTAEVVRNDEVGTLAKAFNSMTSQLRSMFQSQEQRAAQLRTINDVGRRISSILDVDELFKYVATSLQKTFRYHNIGIIFNNEQIGELVLKASVGAYYPGERSELPHPISKPILGAVVKTGDSLLINDLAEYPVYQSDLVSGSTVAELTVPIKIGERVIGIIDIEADHANAFNELDLFTAQTLADQLAIALENARLYEQAQESATLKERTRLARDLHDAVSQTLFSASLIAEVLPKIWERNPQEGRRRLEEIRQLTRGALAEMRTLLLELRPSALIDTELSALLRQLADSITGRARIPVQLEVQGQCQPSPEVKVAFYRIAQEALNNVAKHSGGTMAQIILTCDEESLELIVHDNGKGFDRSKTSPSSLGLGIMQERARGIGARVRIESQPGQGTTVTMVWNSRRVDVEK